jgi:flagellin-like hook-associated protein FlgL
MRNELDRENLQKELDHICSEIDRICKSAKFNTVELFQDVGLEGERTYPEGTGTRELLEAAASDATKEAANVSAEESSPKQVIKIEYFEHDAVNTAQTPGSGSSLAQDMTLEAVKLPPSAAERTAAETSAGLTQAAIRLRLRFWTQSRAALL